MEVRRVVIVEEHRYHDAIEGADRRQELESKAASGGSFDQLAGTAVFRFNTAVDLDEVDVVLARAYPVGSMTRAGEIFSFFGFATRIFAR